MTLFLLKYKSLGNIFFIYLLLLFSCKENQIIDCNLLNSMVEMDQNIRSNPRLNVTLKVADSLRCDDLIAENKHEIEYYFGSANKLIEESPPFHFIDKMVYDSLLSVMKGIDSINTLNLLLIVQNYSKVELLSSKCFSDALFIFAHTPRCNVKIVQQTLINEKIKIPKESFNFIFWHLNGRKMSDLNKNFYQEL